jgi:hypothetical protein
VLVLAGWCWTACGEVVAEWWCYVVDVVLVRGQAFEELVLVQ